MSLQRNVDDFAVVSGHGLETGDIMLVPGSVSQLDCGMEMNVRSVMEETLAALLDKKARSPCVIDISKVTTIARYFVIVSGTSTTHIKALADSVEDRLGKLGMNPYGRSGYNTARWILLDFSEVVVHIFHDDERTFYGLERLWQDGDFLLIHDGQGNSFCQ